MATVSKPALRAGPGPLRRLDDGAPGHGADRLHRRQPPVALDRVRDAARPQDAAKLGEGVHRIVDIDQRVARDDAVEACGVERQAGICQQMCGDALGEPVRLGPGSGTGDELGVDVEGVDMAVGPDALGELDRRVARPAAEIADDQPGADLGAGIELFRRRVPLEHGLVAGHAFRLDLDPVLLEALFGFHRFALPTHPCPL